MLYQLIALMSYAARIYTLIIIVRAVVSWIQPNPYNPIVQILYRLTEPVLFPIRKALAKRLGNIGIDFSPIVAIILINVFVGLIRWILLSPA